MTSLLNKILQQNKQLPGNPSFNYNAIFITGLSSTKLYYRTNFANYHKEKVMCMDKRY